MHQIEEEKMNQIFVFVVEGCENLSQEFKQREIGLFFLHRVVKQLENHHSQCDLDRIGLKGMQKVKVRTFRNHLKFAVFFVVIDNVNDRHGLEIAVLFACAAAAITFDQEIAPTKIACVHRANEA